MTATIFILMAFMFGDQGDAVAKIIINDSEVLKLIDRYDQYIKQEGFDNPRKQHLLLRVEKNGSKQLIYIGSTNLISTFFDDIPNCYAEQAGRIVFIYSDRDSNGGKEKFNQFYNQFETTLGNDITKDIKQNPNFQYGFIHHPEIWRVELSSKRLKAIKQVPQFPSYIFYKDYRYNNDGQMVYRDGFYHNSTIDPHQWEPDNFDLRVYILQNTSVPEYTLKEGIVNAILVIDERGKVIESIIEGLNNETMEEEVKAALEKMPAWFPGKINGTPVKVRLRQRL